MADRLDTDPDVTHRELGALLDEAIQYVEEVLTPAREKATDYYLGRPFGNEETGRSQIVMTDVRDTVKSCLQDLMPVFFGSDKVVEFKPRGPEDEAQARQKTDTVNYVIREQNAGYLEFYSACKDALVRRLGAFKWWWDDTDREEGATYEGLTEDQVIALLSDSTVADFNVLSTETTGGVADAPRLFSVEITRRFQAKQARFAAIPPEEILINPQARSKDDALLIAHRRLVRRSELEAMGYTEDDWEDVAVGGESLKDNAEAQARLPDEGTELDTASEQVDPRYLYIEAYRQIGKSWRLYCTLGPGYKVLKEYPCGQPCFGFLCPDPEPHTLLGGLSMADDTMDLQRLNSAVVRGTVDSLGLAIMPRTEVVEAQVNMGDVLNPEIGGIVRVRAPGMMREVAHRFVGGDTLPFLAYLSEIRENRTARSKAAMGLDPDALQSSTKAAVAATVTASQKRMALIAQIFAETGVKQLMQGLARLLKEHQDQPWTIRLRNEWVTVDPRAWNENMDLSVNVALGLGNVDEKLGFLNAIKEEQKSVLAQLGPVNPLCTIQQYRNTLARAVEISGYPNAAEFFLQVSDEELQQLAQSAAAPKEPSPEQLLAQVQGEQIKAEMAHKAAQLEFDKQRFMAETALKAEAQRAQDDRERDRLAAEIALKREDMTLKYQTEVEKARLQAEIAQLRQTVAAE